MASEDLTRALAAVLGGRGLQVQNWDSGPAGGKPPPPARLRANVSYVVLAVFLNEKDEVLLIQEAKRECRGAWYLPAGRMEPGETIVEALRREVKEEAGLQCEPVTLLAVEERGPSWVRFVFLARPTGGILKTSKEADAESLQAGWFPRTSLATPLRAHDTVHLLELAAQYLQQAWHPPLLPQELPCSVVCQRLIAVFIGVQTLWVLVGTVGTPHLPVTVCDFTPAEQRGGLKVAVLRLLQECLTLHTLTVEPKGVLGLQHLGRDGSDGICLDVLVAVAFHSAGVRAEEPPKVRGENYAWWKVADEDLQSQLRQRLRDCSVVPLNR
ncbi:8-oxo-dGDP phosphatase NUDT18 isoform X1 [Ochotona princeps]|uniref:8-oxo-dGDP phosphatase NUDT18 isoform X1 n=1 Tax=Ochotona princeps TaxID=9978 RepID=UPI0027147961|nr:8-oxo-dGDP phosphatase NUDT18 isoform X1 [Ochotona princeps]XP_058513465.1 8-oxo-dGDP phosphatase NUDT18 isoform X1 [Ochotona princeps]